MYTKCIQNVYHRTMAANFCTQDVFKSLSKCGIHFVYINFVHILYTSVLIYKKCTS